MKRLIFDLQALQNGSRNRGIGRYVLHLFQALARESDLDVYALLNASLSDGFEAARSIVRDTVGEDRLLVFQCLSPTQEIDEDNYGRRMFSEAAYEQFLASIDFDALLVGSLFEGFQDNTIVSLKGAGYRKLVVLYDLIPLLNPDQFLGWDKIHRWYHSRLSHLSQADALLAISESARQEAIEHLGRDPNQVFAIGTATDPQIFHDGIQAETAVLKLLGIDRPFVMHTSAFEERKNFEGLVRAFATLPCAIRAKHQLVLAGNASDEARARLETLARDSGLKSEDLVFTGYVDDAALAQLFRQCSLFVFPSFHEGFGLPALEAMSCGCATIGSNRSSIPEVVGRPDLLFDPADVDEMAALMGQLLSDRRLHADARRHALCQANRFSWEAVGSKAVAAITAAKAIDRIPRQSLEQTVKEIALATVGYSLDPADQRQLAAALVSNEKQSFTQVGRIAASSGDTWRVEGPFDSTYSLALLNRETARALSNLGYDVSLHSTEGPGDFDPNPAFLRANPDIGALHAKSSNKKRRPRTASRLLYPPRVADLNSTVRALHHYAWEESGFPQGWVKEFNSSLDMMTCLSRHVEKIMIDNGVTVPMLTSGCGADHWDRIEADPDVRVIGKSFKFLHVSSCFPRKGADTLLAAFGAAFTADDDVSLVIKTFENPHNDIRSQLELLRRHNPNFPHVELIFADLSDGELKALYQKCDVMVGPSCAEGYGLPFAEAMLSGIPVITTNWGGQLDFCNESNSWLVDFEFERARTHFGLWASAWARANVGALTEAMISARAASVSERRAMAHLGRQQILASHKWSDVALRLSSAAKTLPRRRLQQPKIGWMSTWGSRCGVATYSAHLAKKLSLDTTIFAPEIEDHEEDNGNVLRNWVLGKEGRTYDAILSHCISAEIGVLVIQFNYNFYDHDALERLIDGCRAEGIRVVVFLHSTVDPPEPRAELYHLRHLRALARCDRILVHSIADMNRLKSLGLIDNVTLFPHGVLDIKPGGTRSSIRTETLASYGFALPHKGLEQLVEAVGLLHERGRRIRLRLVNAEYPVDVSREIIADLRNRAEGLGIADFVEHHHEFLPDHESLRLLQDSDLAVFPYQETGESASGAVRYGMAARVPVMVTPIPIFDDLGNAAFRFAGTDAQCLADGIEQVLDELRRKSPATTATLEAADDWRNQHEYGAVASRLANLFTALANLPGSRRTQNKRVNSRRVRPESREAAN